MTCMEVRDRLAEYALGLLRAPDAQEVERHLRWCAGCRHEATELQEGVTVVGLSVPPEEPPPHLEEQIVDRIVGATEHRAPRPSRGGFWALAAATFTAMTVAVGAFGWAIAERNRVSDMQQVAQQQAGQLAQLQRLIDGFPRQAGASLQAELAPLLRSGGFGRAVIFSAAGGGGWVVVDVVPPSPEVAPYSVQVFDHSGVSLSGGALRKTESGDWVFIDFPNQDLSAAGSVSVVDAEGQPVLVGSVRPYVEPSARPAGA